MAKQRLRINADTDFAAYQLRDLLNKEFGEKSSGRPFTNSDVYQYAKKGKLPDKYGGNDLMALEVNGIKFLRLIPKKNK